MRRRAFLAGGLAAAATATIGSWPRRAAAAWGEAPSAAAAEILGPGVRAERCLELFAYGGMGSFESFYVVPEYGEIGNPDPALRSTQWHLFEDDHDQVFGSCGFGAKADWLTPWASDSLGKTVHLGPMVTALKDRPDLIARMRVVVLQHEFEPHETAIPYLLSGLTVGNPRMAGIGAHVQRYWRDRDTTGRVLPWSYVFNPEGDDAAQNTHAASAVGLHPGSARPLKLSMSATMNLSALLGRENIGDDDARVNAYLGFLADRENARYVDAVGVPLRSRHLGDHDFALRSLMDARALQDVLPQEMFAVDQGTSCATTNVDVSAMAVHAAVQLLTDPDPGRAPRYVEVLDGGLLNYGARAFDSHADHLTMQSTNLHHLLTVFAERVNQPGEGDPTKLDLDDTLVLLTTEFARTPYTQVPGGTNHFPHGMLVVMFGGPTVPGLYGGLGPDGRAVEAVSPGELRAAVLAAMGIYPFSVESFAVGDLDHAADELDGLRFLHQTVLGRPA